MPDPREWENWDSGNAAQAIDEYWRTSPVEAAWRQILMVDMQQVFEGPCQILEVGCGSGVIYEAMLDGGLTTPEMYTGGDISKKLLAIAKVRYPSTTFRSLDVYNLPYPDHSQDNVICVSVLQHLPDYKYAVKELLRVTRKYLYLAFWMHEGPEDQIESKDGFYQNVFSLPLFNKLVAEKCRIRHLWLSNYSVVFNLEGP